MKPSEALYEAVKIVAIQELRLDLPELPRSKRAVRSRCTDAAVQDNEEQIMPSTRICTCL